MAHKNEESTSIDFRPPEGTKLKFIHELFYSLNLSFYRS